MEEQPKNRPEDFIDLKKFPATGTIADYSENPQLFEIIRKDPNNVENYLVYADWLQSQNDPRGYLIQLSHKINQCREEQQKVELMKQWGEHIAVNRNYYLGDWGHYLAYKQYYGRAVDTTWYMGYIRDLVVNLDYDEAGKADEDICPFLESILCHPSVKLLRNLRIGDIWTQENISYGNVIYTLMTSPLPDLTSLEIGPTRFQLSWTELFLPEGLAGVLPNLERLVLCAGRIEMIRQEFPKLKSFSIRTGGLNSETLHSVQKCRWPLLESLEIWFGSSEYGADCSAGYLYDIYEANGIENLKTLKLMNCEFADELVEELAEEPVLKQIEHLDISMGTLSDDGVGYILSNRAYAGLKSLDVSDNFLSPAMLQHLKEALPDTNVRSRGQKELEAYDDGYYVSVGE